MAALFERFVRNFYRQRQKAYQVGAETLTWAVQATIPQAHTVLSAIHTDVSLTSEAHKLLIYCEYYRKALKPHYNWERLIYAHLYQLYAYVQHAQHQEPARPVDGLLLYPVVDKQLRHSYQLLDTSHRLRVATIDLNQSWQAVETELLSLLAWH